MSTALTFSFPGTPGFSIEERERAFVVSFGERVRACSWAIVNGGLVDTDHVAWVEVKDDELGVDVDPREFLRARLGREGVSGAVGLLTSRRLSRRVETAHTVDAVVARSVATVGLGNALRAGDRPATLARVGTINLLVHVGVPLTDEGLLEASAIATEAKSAALFDARVPSRQSRALATGTGTDCTVLACPRAASRAVAAYAGKHTAIGAAVGAAVGRALSIGIAEWQKDVGA